MSRIFEFPIYKAELGHRIYSVLFWLFLSAALLSMGVALFPAVVSSNVGEAISEVLQVYPQDVLKQFSLDAIPNLAVYSEYLSLCLRVIFAVGCLYACYLGTSAVIRAESDGSVVFDYAQPVSRSCMVISRFFSQATLLLVYSAGLYFTALFASGSFPTGEKNFAGSLFGVFAFFYLIAFLYLALGFLFSAFLTHVSQASAAALLLFLATLLFDVCGGVTEVLHWMRGLSPYRLFASCDILNGASVSGGVVAVCILVSALCVAVSAFRYHYRDMDV